MDIVSVIVLAYRSASTIVQTLESIKNQTYTQIELIVADDLSPDNTVEVVSQWIEENKSALYDAKLVTTSVNTGIPGNINRALKVTSGKYVKIIAGDDYMSREAIAEYTAFCESNPKKVPIAEVHLFSDEDVTAQFPQVQTYCEKCYEFAKKDYEEQYHMLLMQNRIVAPSASFYPVQLLRDLGEYEESYRWFEDYPMNLKIMHARYGFGLIQKELVYYRMSTTSITASAQLRLKKAELALFRKQRFWYMVQAGMGWEAVKQCKYWIKIARQKE